MGDFHVRHNCTGEHLFYWSMHHIPHWQTKKDAKYKTGEYMQQKHKSIYY